MKVASVCFSMFKVPRSRIYSLTKLCWESIDKSRSGLDGYTSRILASCACGSRDLPRKRWIRRPATVKSGGAGRSIVCSSAPNISVGISGEFFESTDLNIDDTADTEIHQIQLPDLHCQTTENKYMASQVTFLAIDIETTGFNAKYAWIVEIAIRDLQEGKNSTFQTLLNPECNVPNAHEHGITTCMVNRPEVPRFKDLIPVLISFSSSRQEPGGHVAFIAHNGQSFHMPFLNYGGKVLTKQWRIYSLTKLWRESIDKSRSGLDVHWKIWIRRPASVKSEGANRIMVTSGTPNISLGISGEFFESTNLDIAETANTAFQRIQLPDLYWQSTENKDLASQVTFLVIDIETTGFSRKDDRIIEIAIRDLRGGKNCTLQMLVNPECHVPNAYVHGITTSMVNRPEVPRFKDLIPILISFVNSRQKPGGHVVFIAHNGRIFDIPFLNNEFGRCNCEIPSHWLFLDTVPLAREAIRNENGGLNLRPKVSLQALRERYKIPLTGRGHRAMSDVNLLALVFQRITLDQNLLTSTIIEKCFKASDINLGPPHKRKKKKSI